MKTAILITARLKSTRLPMKAIKPIQGRPMICHLIDRLRLSRRAQEIVICTSPIAQDDPLEEIARREGIGCFRGDPDDVLLRLTQGAERVGADLTVNCSADNPLVDPESIDRLVDFHLEQGNDFSRSEGIPWGTFTVTLSYPAMVRACAIKDAVDTEHWGGYFTQTGLFKWGVLRIEDPEVYYPELRLTVDTPEDFQLAERIFEALYEPGKVFPLRAVVALCRKRPELAAINAQVVQTPPTPIRLKRG